MNVLQLASHAWSLLIRTRYGRVTSFSAALAVFVLAKLLASNIPMLPPTASVRASKIMSK